VVGFSVYGDYSEPHPPSRIIEAVADGRIDVAIAWGPLAGYFASRQTVPLDVVPVTSPDQAEQATFIFGIAMATRRDDDQLNAALSRVIVEHEQELRALLTRYHVPLLPDQPAAEESHES
jgi:mxaJ protein